MVLGYNEHPVTAADQLRDLIGQTQQGALVHVNIKRHDVPMTLSVQM